MRGNASCADLAQKHHAIGNAECRGELLQGSSLGAIADDEETMPWQKR